MILKLILFIWVGMITSESLNGLQLIEVTTANQPVALISANDGSGDMYIVENPGIIKRLTNGEQSLFLDITDKVENTFSDQGLLGLVFDPDFVNNGYFYVNYTAAGGQYEFGVTVVERYYFDSLKGVVDLQSATIILSIDQFYHNHNGGTMHFGTDGYLYIAMGDGGMRRDPQNFALDLSELLGKMLRIDVNPDVVFKNNLEYINTCGLVANYYLVDNNPYVNDTQKCGEIFFSGLRSPWKWSFDKDNGDIFVGDVGQDNEEEITHVQQTVTGGENFGWSCKEGRSIILPERCPQDMSELTEPIISYLHNPDNSGNSVVGGYRYRGKEIPELYGHYLYADTISGQIWAAQYDGETWQSRLLFESEFLVVSFAEDDQGNLYTVNFTGIIKRLASKK